MPKQGIEAKIIEALEVRAADHGIDVVDVEVAGTFPLEVSSPGLSRPLRRARDFERFAGSQVSLSLVPGTEGRRRYTGVLRGIADGVVTLDVDGEDVSLDLDAIAKCNVRPDFGDAAKGKRNK